MGLRNKLREYRRKRKMTQVELAEKSTVSRGTIVSIERGTVKNVKSNTLLKLSNALNIPVAKIFLLIKFNTLNIFY